MYWYCVNEHLITMSKDPEYARMSELLPEYRASLEARYPQICSSCLPSVEEEIKRRDNMARSSALAGFLKTSRGKGKERQSSTTQLQQQRSALEREQFFWRIRGVFWGVTLLCSVGCYVAGEYSICPPPRGFSLTNSMQYFVDIHCNRIRGCSQPFRSPSSCPYSGQFGILDTWCSDVRRSRAAKYGSDRDENTS